MPGWAHFRASPTPHATREKKSWNERRSKKRLKQVSFVFLGHLCMFVPKNVLIPAKSDTIFHCPLSIVHFFLRISKKYCNFAAENVINRSKSMPKMWFYGRFSHRKCDLWVWNCLKERWIRISRSAGVAVSIPSHISSPSCWNGFFQKGKNNRIVHEKRMAEVVYGPIFRLTAATLTIKTSLKTLFLPKDLVISEKVFITCCNQRDPLIDLFLVVRSHGHSCDHVTI